MKKVKFKPQGTVVVQFTADHEVDAVSHEGVLYVPLVPGIDAMQEGGKITSRDAEDDGKTIGKKSAKDGAEDDGDTRATRKSDAPAAPVKTSSTKYNEDELMAMDVKELQRICVKMDIDFEKEIPGKKTNKALRLLILDAQDGGSPVASAPATTSRRGGASDEKENPVTAKLIAIIKGLDGGDLTETKATEKLVELGMSKKDAAASVSEFMDNGDLKAESYAKTLVDLVSAEEEEEEEEEKSSKRTPTKTAKSKVVTEDELEEGDEISVYWEDNEEWYDGVVKKCDRKGTLVKYNADGEEAYLDENNTEIKLLTK